MNILRFLFLLLAMSVATGAWSSQHPRVAMETSMGTIEIELYPDKAPATVENFLDYVRDGFYDGTIFHRVIKRFMIQGGGYDASMNKKPTRDPIRNEADNGLRNERGTIAMARTNVPDSATSQFFINHKDNAPLDHTGKTERGWGYAVFGKVTRGMDVVDAIASVKTRVIPPGIVRDVPVETVTIHKVSIISGE